MNEIDQPYLRIVDDLTNSFENLIVNVNFPNGLDTHLDYTSSIDSYTSENFQDNYIDIDYLLEEIACQTEKSGKYLIRDFTSIGGNWEDLQCYFIINFSENVVEYCIERSWEEQIYFLSDDSSTEIIQTNSPYHQSGDSKISKIILNSDGYKPVGVKIINAYISQPSNFNHKYFSHEIKIYGSAQYLADEKLFPPEDSFDYFTQGIKFGFPADIYSYNISYWKDMKCSCRGFIELHDFFKMH